MKSGRLLVAFPAVGLICLLCGGSRPSIDAPREATGDIAIAALKDHVYRLAAPEFLGRRGPGAARASQYVADAFAKLQMKPAFGTSYFQPIPWLLADDQEREESFVGRNVAAILPGSDPQLRDEWILLSAHFDHLGKVGDRLYPGADDNASGIAMLLEVARLFTQRLERPRRTIVFAAFDLEESSLQGSTHFATRPPREFKNLKAMLVADMLGRSMGNLMDEYVYVLGSETAPQLRKLIEEVKPGGGVKEARLGADLVGTRSDYGPFRDRRVPFLFFSTGQHPDYHKPTDLPNRVDYAKLRRISLWIAALTWRLANDAETPQWNEDPPRLDMEEARSVLALVSRALERKGYPLTNGQRELLRGVRERLAGIDQRNAITPAERSWLVWQARLLLMTVF
jgi:hypothetical protein